MYSLLITFFKIVDIHVVETIMIMEMIMKNLRHVHQNHVFVQDLCVAINKKIQIQNKIVPFGSMKKKRKKNVNVF